MSISIQQAADSILRAGLVDDSSLASAFRELDGAGRFADGHSLLDHFTAEGRLTSFQAQMVGEGRSGELVLGNYVILNRIGEGGMGAVFKAMHRRMNRVVAVKLIRRGLATSEFIERFRREIVAAARLNHPHVIAAYDADECELGDFLVMEYVEGADLRQIVEKSGPLPVPVALDVLHQAAQALSYAHQHGIVHRDVKPANLMRDIHGVTKLADLGLARLVEPGGKQESDGLTEAGVVTGTVDYMPPEQARDTSSVDHRADIYSLGCTFYYLLNGAPPFAGGSVLDRILAHRDTPPPALLGNMPSPPPEAAKLDEIFQKMLAKEADDRFQSMDEVIAAIDALRQRDTPSVGAPERDVLRDLTVLVVEHSRLQASMITRQLNAIGIDDVHVTSDASETIEKLSSLATHLVLASARLPDASGLQLAERIRDELRWSRVAVLIMSSDRPARSVQEALLRLGAMGWIQKPFQSEQLRDSITAVMSAGSSAPDAISALSARRVLIVDDSSLARRRIQQVLTDIGFKDFATAQDGLDGVDLLSRERFDLVITDYNMPRMDGRQFVGWIRSQSPQQKIPIIMVTTEYDPAKLAAIYQLGVSAICGKSFDPELVRNVVIRLFL